MSRASTSLTRGQAERDVPHELDQHAAEPAYENRAEGGVGRDPDQGLDPAAHLVLEEDGVEGLADRVQALAERRDRGRDRRRRLEAEHDAPDVALVEEARRDRLGHQRKPQTLGRGLGLGRHDSLTLSEVDAGRAQHHREARPHLGVERSCRLELDGAGTVRLGKRGESLAGRARERGVEVRTTDLCQEPDHEGPSRSRGVAGERPGMLAPRGCQLICEAGAFIDCLLPGRLDDHRRLALCFLSSLHP
jgi:hypothetical protein